MISDVYYFYLHGTVLKGCIYLLNKFQDYGLIKAWLSDVDVETKSYIGPFDSWFTNDSVVPGKDTFK